MCELIKLKGGSMLSRSGRLNALNKRLYCLQNRFDVLNHQRRKAVICNFGKYDCHIINEDTECQKCLSNIVKRKGTNPEKSVWKNITNAKPSFQY